MLLTLVYAPCNKIDSFGSECNILYIIPYGCYMQLYLFTDRDDLCLFYIEFYFYR